MCPATRPRSIMSAVTPHLSVADELCLQILRFWSYMAKFQMVGVALATLVAVSVHTDLLILGESASFYINLRYGIYSHCVHNLIAFALINVTTMVCLLLIQEF